MCCESGFEKPVQQAGHNGYSEVGDTVFATVKYSYVINTKDTPDYTYWGINVEVASYNWRCKGVT